MRRFRFVPSLLFVVLTFASGLSAKWEPEMAAFAAADAAAPSGPGSVLFVGSSSIRLWRSLAEDFPRATVINRGFGGSEISDALTHFDVLVKPHQPRLIVFYAGSNDLARGKSAAQVASDYAAFCAKVHAALPQTRLVFLSIVAAPARWDMRAAIAEANHLIAAACATDPRREFLDVNTVLLGEDGSPRSDYFSADRLHLSPLGYVQWAQTVAPRLEDVSVGSTVATASAAGSE